MLLIDPRLKDYNCARSCRIRRVGRADEGTSLENWHALAGIVGSNPTPSAILKKITYSDILTWRSPNETPRISS